MPAIIIISSLIFSLTITIIYALRHGFIAAFLSFLSLMLILSLFSFHFIAASFRIHYLSFSSFRFITLIIFAFDIFIIISSPIFHFHHYFTPDYHFIHFLRHFHLYYFRDYWLYWCFRYAGYAIYAIDIPLSFAIFHFNIFIIIATTLFSCLFSIIADIITHACPMLYWYYYYSLFFIFADIFRCHDADIIFIFLRWCHWLFRWLCHWCVIIYWCHSLYFDWCRLLISLRYFLHIFRMMNTPIRLFNYFEIIDRIFIIYFQMSHYAAIIFVTMPLFSFISYRLIFRNISLNISHYHFFFFSHDWLYLLHILFFIDAISFTIFFFSYFHFVFIFITPITLLDALIGHYYRRRHYFDYIFVIIWLLFHIILIYVIFIIWYAIFLFRRIFFFFTPLSCRHLFHLSPLLISLLFYYAIISMSCRYYFAIIAFFIDTRYHFAAYYYFRWYCWCLFIYCLKIIILFRCHADYFRFDTPHIDFTPCHYFFFFFIFRRWCFALRHFIDIIIIFFLMSLLFWWCLRSLLHWLFIIYYFIWLRYFCIFFSCAFIIRHFLSLDLSINDAINIFCHAYFSLTYLIFCLFFTIDDLSCSR